MKKVMCQKCGKLIEFLPGQEFNPLCINCQKLVEDEKLDQELASLVIDRVKGSLEVEGLRDRGEFDSLIEYSIHYGVMAKASDIHLKSLKYPAIRKGGILFKICDEILLDKDIFKFISTYSLDAKDIKETDRTYDFAIDIGENRFRCNAYHDINGWCVALRIIAPIVTDFQKLGIPKILKKLVDRTNGLILITGPTGSGKSTTLSCLIQYLNETQFKHIITVEDPIEFVYPEGKCLISQREIGNDATSYEEALDDALREDPDIIMIGEMRNKDSFEAAMRAVETGHIVLSTVHTKGALSTISRILDIYNPEQRSFVRSQLSFNLVATISQQLVPTKKPGELVLATEVMVVNDPIRACIREDKLHFLENTIQTNRAVGMHTMKYSLDELYEKGVITKGTCDRFQYK